MKVIGRDSGPVRSPLTDLNESEIEEVAAHKRDPYTLVEEIAERGNT